jgi:hypothetical protein
MNRCSASIVVVTALALATAGALVGCDGGEAEPLTLFIALDREFASFRSWPNAQVGVESDEFGHPERERRVYLNQLPDPDATTFDVGTIIVKTGSGEEVNGGTGTEIHAMAKRALDFNEAGAAGWEWFELVEIDDTPTIAWRGPHPPDGDDDGAAYGCRPGLPCEGFGDCNVCHQAAVANDYVMSEPLRFSNLAGGSLESALLP